MGETVVYSICLRKHYSPGYRGRGAGAVSYCCLRGYTADANSNGDIRAAARSARFMDA